MTPQTLQQRTLDFEETFRRIRDRRMRDVPLLNPRIGVHLIGLRPWKDGAIGVLVTPWFMNLILLPSAADDWETLPELSEHEHAFPSGRYRFILSREPGLGSYLSCSLFSPMFEFADDQAAVDTAVAVLEQLMNPDNLDPTDIEARDIPAIWRGDIETPTAEETGGEALRSLEGSRGEAAPAISRRQLLRGALRGEERTK